MRFINNKLNRHLDDKLKTLISNSRWTLNSNENHVINISSKPLDSNSKKALGYGLSFHINSAPNYLKLATSFHKLERGNLNNLNDLSIAKGIIYASYAQHFDSNFPKRYKLSLSNLKKDVSLHITKADKANAVVVMDKTMYIDKMLNLLNDNNTYSMLNSNPLESVNAEFNKKLRNILPNHKELVKDLTVYTPILPYLYGLVKTHKLELPMRPIISTVSSVSYKLAKFLVKILSPLVGTISNSHVKNNSDFIDKINNFNVSYPFKLVSFDVSSLFTNVPLDQLLTFLIEFLDNNDLSLPVSNDALLKLIELCCKGGKFVFNDTFFEQKFGLSMGNPLSPVLSNLYMEFFETKLLKPILPFNNIPWVRYIDDIFCIWPLQFDVYNFLPILNNLAPTIKFTIECEENNEIPFLDVKVHKNNCGFEFSVYRKPTSNSSYIHYYSGHDNKIKKSVFHSMYLRALRICSPSYFDAEIEKIQLIGQNLKYPPSFLTSAYNAAKKTFYRTGDKPIVDFKNTLVVPYNPNLVIARSLLRTLNISLIFTYKDSIKNILIKNSPLSSFSGCTYKIPCNDCNQFYIGQTSKALNVRIKQHQYDIRLGKISNAIFCHQSNYNHSINWRDSCVVKRCNDFLTRNAFESALIQYTSAHNFNMSPGWFSFDHIILKKLIKQLDFPVLIPLPEIND